MNEGEHKDVKLCQCQCSTYPGWSNGWFKKDCNSGWAFAAAGVLEGVYSWKTNQEPVSFSKQELIECAYEDGCKGGDPYVAFLYIEKFGISKANDYGYRYASRMSCHRTSTVFEELFGLLFESPRFYSAFYIDRLYPGGKANAKELMDLIEKYGPICVHVSVGKKFNDYGKYWALSSSDVQVPGGTSHSVVVVGFGGPDNSKKPYWIIRNSYGSDWGSYGYGLLEQTEDASEINRE
ncbi:PREDICTED: dipeptidyl peptidase 1-like, partial [Rhagoletis zephyria]|uniref:dipeptidyl peptidase 1-like n=1 Tax=Rhagoletis zephyria TaxID=28612 RepID=UPI0008116080